MKYFKNIFIASALVIAATSCVNDDVNFTTTDKPVVSITGQTASSVAEGQTITVTLTSNKPYKERLDFKVDLVSGGQNADYMVGDGSSATSVDDGFGAFGYKVSIPANETTTSFDITAVRDVLKEGTENLRLQVRSTNNINALVQNHVQYIDLEVTNYVEDKVALEVDFTEEVSYRSIEQKLLTTPLDDEAKLNVHTICDMADFDIFLGGFQAYGFTGNCPETVSPNTDDGGASVLSSTLADGSYPVIVDLWTLDLLLSEGDPDNEILDGDIPLPISVTISHVGSFNTTIELPSTYFTFSDFSDNVGGAGERQVATIEVVGGKYKVWDMNGELVAAE